ncbi:MAG: cation diffusion facilitator family transporter [Rickettsiales bacterium]
MSHREHHFTLNKRAVYLSISLSVFLVLCKAYAWLVTDSVSLLSSLLDSSLDVVVSTCNMLALLYSAKPADDDHSFGHDAIEDIVGLVQAAFIGASGLFLIYEASHRFFDPQPVEHALSGIVVLIISIVCALVIVLYERYVAKKTGSIVIEADLMHYFSDLLMNAAIIVSLFLASRPQWAVVDPVLAVAIAMYILTTAFSIGVRAFNNLMDRELPDEVRKDIVDILNGDRDIIGYHELKTRRSGSKIFIQFHLDLDESLSLKRAHDIAAGVRQKILASVGEAEIIIHEDPKAVT